MNFSPKKKQNIIYILIYILFEPMLLLLLGSGLIHLVLAINILTNINLVDCSHQKIICGLKGSETEIKKILLSVDNGNLQKLDEKYG